MTFSQAINTCFQKYAVFSGRAKRSEYWWWFLFSALAGIPFSLLDSFSENVLFTLISLAISIALSIFSTHALSLDKFNVEFLARQSSLPAFLLQAIQEKDAFQILPHSKYEKRFV